MRILLLALLFLLACDAHAQTIAEVLHAARIPDLVQSVMSPEWFEGGDPEAEDDSTQQHVLAFYTSANQAYASATHDALLSRLDAIPPEDLTALAHPAVARIDSAAWSIFRPAGITEELADVMSYMEPASSLALADSALVEEYMMASGVIERMATILWMQQASPHHASAEALSGYTEEELKAHAVDIMLFQFRTPIRYALRTADPAAIEQATAAHRSAGGGEIIAATMDGMLALSPYIDEIVKLEAAMMDWDMEEDVPTLQFPETE